MTGKRFTYDFDTGFVSDNKTGNSYEMFKHNDGVEITSLLNALHEENEELKSICQDHKDHAIDFKADCIRLEKENEQLKKDVDYWKQVASQYSNELNVFEHCKKYKTECKDIHWSSD